MFAKNKYMAPCLLVFSIALPVCAEPVIHIKHKLYSVNGTSAKAIRSSMTRNSPVIHNGIKHDARTDWFVSWNYRWHQSQHDCALTSVSTKLEVTYTIPELTTLAELKEPVTSQWNTYYTALLQHEKGHKDFGLKSAREIEQALLAISPQSNCDELEKEANATGHRILKKYAQLEKAYDRTTNHGVNNGAIFP